MNIQTDDIASALRRRLAAGACIGALAGSAASAQVATLIDDGFGDGDRDNDAVLDGPVSDASDAGVPWYLGRGTSDIVVAVADDPAGIGSGGALDVLTSTTSTRPFIASFAPITLMEDGDSISMTFDVRVTESPIDGTDGGSLSGDGDRRFRFGLFNSQGTPVIEDTGDSSITNDDTGYLAQIDVGSAGGTTYTVLGDKADGILGGSSVGFGASSSDPAYVLGNSTSTLGLTLTRSGADVLVSIFFDGVEAQSGVADFASDIDPFNLPYTIDSVAFGTNGGSFDYRLDNVLVEFVDIQPGAVSSDGFEDGDRDNDGSPEGAVNDATDIGFAWYLSEGTSDFTVGVVDESGVGGIGTGNALNPLATTTNTRAVTAPIDEVTLAELGDQVSFAFDLRLVGTIPSSDRRFRFGIQNDNGTAVVEDGGTVQTGDDTGYMVQVDTGPSSSSTATVRGDLPNGLLRGSTRSLGGTSDDSADALDDNNVRRVEIRVRRGFDDTLMQPINVVSYLVDGQLVTDGEDDGDGDPEPLTFSFNQIAIATNNVANLDYVVDNVEVVFIPGQPSGDLNTDGFEDGDRDNDGAPEGTVNDASDIGFTWYQSTGSGSFNLTIADDSGVGGIDTGNALNHFSLTTSGRTATAAIGDVSLESPGDFVELSFDLRLRGPITTSDRKFRFGIHNDGGTPVVEDGGTRQTDDDLGYNAQFDTGASSDSTATVRGDLANGILAGSTRSLGGTSDDPLFALDDNTARRLSLRVTREFDAVLGRDVNRVTLMEGMTIITEGVDEGDGAMDTDPVTYDFNQISIGTNGASFLDILIDNVEVQVSTQPACPPDLNDDGALDYFDWALFLNNLVANDASADLNGDNAWDATDVNLFELDFNAGCP